MVRRNFGSATPPSEMALFYVYINLGTGVGKEEKNVEFAHKKVFQKLFKNVLWKLLSWKLL